VLLEREFNHKIGNLLKLYLTTLAFLAFALVVNSSARWLGLPTWYDFLAQSNLSTYPIIHLLWLFGVYPLILGLLIKFFKNF
jgi:hypothetical protein